jgi:toxin ParE1/3/4
MPAQYHVAFTRRARADLNDIYDYIAKDSPQNAANFVAELVQAILNLQQLPHRYPIYKSRRWSRRIIRRMPLWPYQAYYNVNGKQRRVEVITVRHGMRRQP